jgi:hypothetical protein
MRIVETTLFSPWFYVDPDYQSWSLIRNTTDTSVSVTITWRDASGLAWATKTFSIGANGTISPEAKANAVPNEALGGSGSVEIAHNGSENAIVATQTSLSAKYGVSFDAPMTARQPW